ncbi:Hypothetical predicted protein [Mytilus galloprovincialis]|uniref:Uncharacterized protein n=1 Tax=Mytilus galloprovincialis TaxID=29158 RepID=A0A8B6HQH5_MYTGA|nr:Hypothetical predicted protein [Mytilus galloprovincialis]
METSLLLTLLFAIAVTVVVSVPTKSHKEANKRSDYDWYRQYDDYGNYDLYDDYDWYGDDYWDDYDWNDYYDCDLTDGNVKKCISGDCVDVNDICSGVDSCSSMENDWFCTVYVRGIEKANDSIKKRNLGKGVDDKKLKTKVYQLITRKIKATKQKKVDNGKGKSQEKHRAESKEY